MPWVILRGFLIAFALFAVDSWICASAEKVQLDRQKFGPVATLLSLQSPRCVMWGCDRYLGGEERKHV